MPIHDQSYRRYAGGKALPGQAWTVIARAGMMNMIRKRAFLGLLIFAWLPFLVRAVQIYVTANYPQVAMFAANEPRTMPGHSRLPNTSRHPSAIPDGGQRAVAYPGGMARRSPSFAVT